VTNLATYGAISDARPTYYGARVRAHHATARPTGRCRGAGDSSRCCWAWLDDRACVPSHFITVAVAVTHRHDSGMATYGDVSAEQYSSSARMRCCAKIGGDRCAGEGKLRVATA